MIYQIKSPEKNTRLRQYLKKLTPKRFIILITLLIISIVIFNRLLLNKSSQKSNNLVKVADAINTTESETKPNTPINKDFSISVDTTKGKIILKYDLESAELTDNIVLKGQSATAVKGRLFLILNLKITNLSPQGVYLNTRDYVRLSANDTDWLAPEIYNDPVEIQAISTKQTRIGFPVDAKLSSFKLQIGEINAKKEIIPITI